MGPATEIPVPKSNFGKIEDDDNDYFLIYVGRTTKEDFLEYVQWCKDLGYVYDYDVDDSYYNAKNSENQEITVDYLGYNIMSVELYKQIVRTYIKDKVNNYESFIDEYVSFIQEYNADPSNLELMDKYEKYQEKYEKKKDKFDELEVELVNENEDIYYAEAASRINKKIKSIN